MKNKVFSFENFLANAFSVPLLTSAIKINLFEFLCNQDYYSPTKIKEGLDLKINLRNFEDYLDKLYQEGYLERKNESNSFYYRNTESSNKYFVRCKEDNLISNVLRIDELIKIYQRDLVPILQNGKKETNVDFFSDLYKSKNDMNTFLRSMQALQRDTFIEISKSFDFAKYNVLLDVGGGLGQFSCVIKKNFPKIKCLTFDLSVIRECTVEYLKEHGMEGKVEIVEGDMFKDIFPKSDIISLGNILHDYSLDKKLYLLKKVYDSLDPGGILIIMEKFIKDDRSYTNIALDISILMMVDYENSYNMTFKEVEQYTRQVGFKKISFLESVDTAICYK
jgi:ubiquinone/menaquinone biosynthesis C-methylase UbiE